MTDIEKNSVNLTQHGAYRKVWRGYQFLCGKFFNTLIFIQTYSLKLIEIFLIEIYLGQATIYNFWKQQAQNNLNMH